ncbi:MAG: VWA domain-containing protein [Candidatus Solibacter sp.]|nr:VWA domain-containing protein [Candidatus Solibacter sp.]
MTRCLACLLVCAVAAFSQSASPPPAAPSPWVVDAVALDAAGRPVVDLTAEDFEIVQGGRARKIVNFTWFDTRLHLAVSRPGQAEQLPALDLLPDEIRRNVVVVVDDLGLTLAGIHAARSALREFVGSGISSGDRMAILRSSGGSGALQQLTGDIRTLVNAIDGIRYLGGSTSAASAGSATWLTLGYALRGLREEAGRKVVVVLTENPGAGGPRDGAAGEALPSAHAAAAAVYTMNPLSAAPGGASAAHSPLESLVRDTGGASGGDFGRILQAEQGYYAIGFQLEDSSVDALPRRLPQALAAVRVPGAGGVRFAGRQCAGVAVFRLPDSHPPDRAIFRLSGRRSHGGSDLVLRPERTLFHSRFGGYLSRGGATESRGPHG